MNPQFSYVDSNLSYGNVARPNDMRTVSSNPNSYDVQESVQHNLHASANSSSYYGQRPMQNNLYNSTYSSNLQHVDLNSHASASPSPYYVHKPMDNMVNSFNQYETPNLSNFNGMQSSVSYPYPSAHCLPYVSSPPNMPMDREVGHVPTSYLGNYPPPSYAAPYATNFSAPCATNVLSSSTAAYGTSPVQLQIFGNTSMPKETKSIGGHPIIGTKEWWDNLENDFITGMKNIIYQDLVEKSHDAATIRQ